MKPETRNPKPQPSTPDPQPPAPEPTSLLAIARYLQGQLTEGHLARKLGLDGPETRTRVAEFLNVAIANAGVPALLEQQVVARTEHLEGRRDLWYRSCLAWAGFARQAGRILANREQVKGKELVDLATAARSRIAELETTNHDLRNQVTLLTLQVEELQIDLDTALSDLAAERQHLAELAREQGSGVGGRGSPEGSAPMD